MPSGAAASLPDVRIESDHGGDPAPEAASVAHLVGAALALGAERTPGWSAAERALCASLVPARPRPTRLRALRERIRAGEDPLGEAFCRLRSAAERRGEGATYTPAETVDAMVAWAAGAAGAAGVAAGGARPARMIDPGAGSGRFTLAAGRCFPRAHLLAVERDPLAAVLARANLAEAGMAHRAEVVCADYRDLRPPAVAGPTLYLGNPPYVRHHLIAPEWKAWLTRTAHARGLAASGLAGLHAHFFLATAEQARPGDLGAFITSAEWLDVNYGALVRALVLDGLGGQAVHVLEPVARAFDDAATAAITCFVVGSRPGTLRLRRAGSLAALRTLGGGRPVRRERLEAAARWSPLTRARRRDPAEAIPLGEICAVHRGAVTGANAVWLVEPADANLPSDVLLPAVTRARELFAAGGTLRATAGLRALVVLPDNLDHLALPQRRQVAHFLARARALGAHERYIARHRTPWWTIRPQPPAPILVSYMARQAPAVVRNLAGARHVNIAHGLYPREPLDDATLDALADVLRTTIRVEEGRTYAGGLTKFEPREIERLRIPDPRRRCG